MTQDNNIKYAGVGGRLAAFVIDCALVKLAAIIITWSITSLVAVLHIAETNNPALVGAYVYIIVSILYFSLLDSSKLQATLGKMLYRIQTVDINQQRLSFWKALEKSLIMWLIPIFFVGNYVIPAILVMAIPILFTQKKQALFDMIAGCLVVKKNVMD